MQALITNYEGPLIRCNSCRTVYKYSHNEVAADGTLKCPQCGFTIKTRLVADYDGVVKEEAKDIAP